MLNEKKTTMVAEPRSALQSLDDDIRMQIVGINDALSVLENILTPVMRQSADEIEPAVGSTETQKSIAQSPMAEALEYDSYLLSNVCARIHRISMNVQV